MVRGDHVMIWVTPIGLVQCAEINRGLTILRSTGRFLQSMTAIKHLILGWLGYQASGNGGGWALNIHGCHCYRYNKFLASQSDAHRIAPHRDPIQPNPRPRPTYSSEARKTHDVIYFWKGPQKQCYQVSDTQIYKCKYTNTQIDKYSLGQIIR